VPIDRSQIVLDAEEFCAKRKRERERKVEESYLGCHWFVYRSVSC
jgi:hypothetical protein